MASVLIARILGKNGVGEWGMVNSTVGMFGVFAGFGLGLTAGKHVAEFRDSDPQRAGRIIGLSRLATIGTGGVMALGLFIFAPWLAQHTINAPHLTNVLRIGALILYLSALNGAQTGALSGFEAFKRVASVNLYTGLASPPLLFLGAYFGGLAGVVWASVLLLCISWLLNHFALRAETRRSGVLVTMRDCGKELPILWKFTLPAVLGYSIVGPTTWACGAMLVNQPDGYGEMGLFNVAVQWRTAILFFPSMVGGIVLPVLSNLHGQNDRGRYAKVLKINYLLNGGSAIFAATAIALCARWILRPYGPGFEQGLWVLIITAFTAVLVSVNTVVGQAITSRGKTWFGFLFNGVFSFVLLAATAAFLSRGYGALGLASAYFVAYLVHTAGQGFYLRRALRAADG